MQNVLPVSGARVYTVSDEASADQRYRKLKRTVHSYIVVIDRVFVSKLVGGGGSSSRFRSSPSFVTTFVEYNNLLES